MNRVRLVALFLVLATAPLHAQAPRWTVDVTPASYVEAWDLNAAREWLHGVHAGVDRVAWRALAPRVEGVLLRVRQDGRDAWVRGATLGVRTRFAAGPRRLFVDVAAGRSWASDRVPSSGTRGNYILALGGGVEAHWAGVMISAGGRWLHLSNNGREGRARNPDVQALGGHVGVGWKF